jgi:hypothetical protein
MSTHTLYARSPDWETIGGLIDDVMHGSGFRLVKETQRTLAGITQLNGIEVFVKRVSNKSWIKGIIARFCGSRARKTIRGANLLQGIGFAHPKLIAAFEQRHAASVTASYIIVEYLRRPKILSRFALADGHDYHWRRWVSKRLAQTIRRLHAEGCYTRDLQETNLMLAAQDGTLKVYFTDLEDFRRLPLVPWQLRLNNLLQLDRSIGRFISRTHRLRFLYDYWGENARRIEVRALVERLNCMRQRLERRKLRRQRSTVLVTPTHDTSRTDKIYRVPLRG